AEIRVEEVGKQVGRLKRGKAPGRDGLVNEVWIFGTDGMIERLSELMNDVWTGKGFPRECRVGQICPINKKGSKEKVENYRGITLLNTAYKLYAMVLNERLLTEMNEKSILPESQAGFRRGREAMDNVYILHHLIEKELLKGGGRVYALFVDL
ncbi:reverse transcriptase domain-containing protein, partial [Enterobacter cloacae complex sp. 2DZ2F20B]|uniref:reverse transcriptase domain-containing protein n=1 Tax=Enterobacter cloacae complex sp. 2DZ2F20B TaxID=2511993 RepID=UPI001026D4E1